MESREKTFYYFSVLILSICILGLSFWISGISDELKETKNKMKAIGGIENIYEKVKDNEDFCRSNEEEIKALYQKINEVEKGQDGLITGELNLQGQIERIKK